jgi:hypothetical protein
MEGLAIADKKQYINFYCIYNGKTTGQSVVSDCGSNNLKEDAAAAGARTAFKGNYKLNDADAAGKTINDCPNVNKSGFFLSQSTAGVEATDDFKDYVSCSGWRSSTAASTYINKFSNGQKIRFSTGFKEFPKSGTSTTSAQSEWVEFTVSDGALALTASLLAAASTQSSLLF